MHIKFFLKYVLGPLLLVLLVIVVIFHRPIVRYYTFDRHFDALIEHRGQNRAMDDADRIIRMGPAAEAPLIERYQNSPKVVDKYYALYLLGRIQSDKGAPLLLEALQNPSPSVRWGAIRGLRYMMRPEYAPAVVALADDPVRSIRFDAITTLEKADVPESLRKLEEITRTERDQKLWARAWASLRFLNDVDGVVTEKYRFNRDLKLIPADDEHNEVGYTYYFVKVSEKGAVREFNLPMRVWKDVKTGDRLRKGRQSDEFKIIPSAGAERA